MDCILSRLQMVNPSSTANTRSVSDALPYPIIADLGSKHADCPIFFIITIPELITLSHLKVSNLDLVEKAIRGSPNNKICRNTILIVSLAVSLGLFLRRHKWFSIVSGRFTIAYCFSVLVIRFRKWLRPPIPDIILSHNEPTKFP